MSRYTQNETLFVFAYGSTPRSRELFERSINFETRESAEAAAAQIRASGRKVGEIKEIESWPYREPCSYHVAHEFKTYAAFKKNAAALEKRGEKQSVCPDCNRYFYSSQMGKRPKGFKHPGARVDD